LAERQPFLLPCFDYLGQLDREAENATSLQHDVARDTKKKQAHRTASRWDLEFRLWDFLNGSLLTNAFPTPDFYLPPRETIVAEAQREQRGHFNIIHTAALPGFSALGVNALGGEKALVNALGSHLNILLRFDPQCFANAFAL